MADGITWYLSESEAEDIKHLFSMWLEDMEYDVGDGQVGEETVARFRRILRLFYVTHGYDWEHVSGPWSKNGMPAEHMSYGRWWESQP